MRRVGPKMKQAAEFVARNPGCSKLAVAEWGGPNGSRKFGYAIVNRAIRAGLIQSFRDCNREYSLYTEVA